jgi:Haem-binding domain
MWKRLLIWLGAALVAAFLVAWGVGEAIYPRTNPPQRYDGPILSDAGDTVLRSACFDCHSNETRHPWYRHLPLAALFIGLDIREGRNEVNFSRWGTMDEAAQRKALRRALHEVDDGDMPPLQYRLLHPEARLDGQQRAGLERDALARYGVRPGEAGDGEGGKRD